MTLFGIAELVYIFPDPVQLPRNVYALRTMVYALSASYAVVCLPYFRYSPVVADEICPPVLPVVLVL